MNVLAKFYWDCGRQGCLEGVFIADKEDIESAVGKEVYFGEVLGKHSEIYGTIDEGDITIVSEDQTVVDILLEVFGGDSISGFNPLSYIEESEPEEE